MKTIKSDPVQEYILESKDNLCIAAAVSAAWPQAGDKLVSGFLDRLRSRLEKKLEGWQFARSSRCFLIDSDASFYFWRPAWKEDYYVHLYFYDHGQGVRFGLGRDQSQQHIKKRQFIPELLPAITERYQSARKRTWWEAWVGMRSPAADWHDPKVLWQAHTDHKFLEDVAEQLLGVAEISEPIVDPLVEQLAGKKQPAAHAASQK